MLSGYNICFDGLLNIQVTGGNSAVGSRKGSGPSQSGLCDVAPGEGEQVHQGSGGVRGPVPECCGCLWSGPTQGSPQTHGAGATFRFRGLLLAENN